MNLRDLLDDAEEEGDSAGVYRVFLATRTVDGEELERDQVRVMNIGGLRVDPDHEEVGLIPAVRDGADQPTFTIAAARRMLAESPELASFELIALKEHVRSPDGQDAEMVCAIGGSLTKRQEIWLLLHPMAQWQDFRAGISA